MDKEASTEPLIKEDVDDRTLLLFLCCLFKDRLEKFLEKLENDDKGV